MSNESREQFFAERARADRINKDGDKGTRAAALLAARVAAKAEIVAGKYDEYIADHAEEMQTLTGASEPKTAEETRAKDGAHSTQGRGLNIVRDEAGYLNELSEVITRAHNGDAPKQGGVDVLLQAKKKIEKLRVALDDLVTSGISARDKVRNEDTTVYFPPMHELIDTVQEMQVLVEQLEPSMQTDSEVFKKLGTNASQAGYQKSRREEGGPNRTV